MSVDFLYCTVLGYELACTYFADSFDSGNVVGRVAAYGQDLDDLFRPCDVVFLADLCDIDDFIVGAGLARLVLKYVLGDQLTVVLVRSHHVYGKAFLFSPLGHRSDYVVSLESLDHQNREVHRLAKFAERFKRIDDQLGSLASCSLIFRVHLVSECASRRVECNRQVGRLLLLNEFQYVFCESEQH